MPPETSLTTVPSRPEDSFEARFRRGKRLVLALAVITGVYFVAESLYNHLVGTISGGWFNLLINWVFIGWVCWCVFRGGPLAGGCLLFSAFPLLFCFLFGMAAVVGNLVIPAGHFSIGVDRFREIGSDWKSTLSFLPFGAWAAYAVWVLLISKDARLYREARRRGVAEAEANAFEWPPRHRRQG